MHGAVISAHSVICSISCPGAQAFGHGVSCPRLDANRNFALHCAQAKAVADAALAFLAGFNRRTLDMIASRIYFYFALAHERLNSLASIRRYRCALLLCTCVLDATPCAPLLWLLFGHQAWWVLRPDMNVECYEGYRHPQLTA